MTMTFLWSDKSDCLWQEQNMYFDAWQWQWMQGDITPNDLTPISAQNAMRAITGSNKCRTVPVAVIGPREADETENATAENVGKALADLGLATICGGKNGVMEAAARGAYNAGGLTIGLLPDEDWHAANPFISLPLATGIGRARNAIIAQSAQVLIAVGGKYGTLSEIAYGLQFGKPVFGLCTTPDVPGLRTEGTVDATIEALVLALLTPQHM
ncbi:TIGR00725 family protein [Thalassospira sp. TSL5-1]|uniref:TIGR00725 family protein n=1 Tax=Thalassospira sp. TSL5-1 TaxID=1544451 RepID=UPI000A87494F|nr:TIGR00725 family protein [Thalassospira sp. TSL5-1]